MTTDLTEQQQEQLAQATADLAEKMAAGWYGKVTFSFQAGKLLHGEIRETKLYGEKRCEGR